MILTVLLALATLTSAVLAIALLVSLSKKRRSTVTPASPLETRATPGPNEHAVTMGEEGGELEQASEIADAAFGMSTQPQEPTGTAIMNPMFCSTRIEPPRPGQAEAYQMSMMG